jgi:type VI secretion system secreted protein Hcp
MDLILLQPGDKNVFGGTDNGWASGGTLIDYDPAKGTPYADDPGPMGPYIELVSVHQGLKQQVTTDVSNSARTSGRPIITEFTCVKYVDKTSVRFYDYCLRAMPLGKGADQPTKIYILRNSGEQTMNIITFSLRDAIISEIQFQSHPDDMPTEQFKINFTEILWEYTSQNTDATSGGKHAAGWSVARNRSIGKLSS